MHFPVLFQHKSDDTSLSLRVFQLLERKGRTSDHPDISSNNEEFRDEAGELCFVLLSLEKHGILLTSPAYSCQTRVRIHYTLMGTQRHEEVYMLSAVARNYILADLSVPEYARRRTLLRVHLDGTCIFSGFLRQ